MSSLALLKIVLLGVCCTESHFRFYYDRGSLNLKCKGVERKLNELKSNEHMAIGRN